jgi:hypothetical protein
MTHDETMRAFLDFSSPIAAKHRRTIGENQTSRSFPLAKLAKKKYFHSTAVGAGTWWKVRSNPSVRSHYVNQCALLSGAKMRAKQRGTRGEGN